MSIGIKIAQKINGNSIYLTPSQWDDLSAGAIASRLDTGTGRLAYDYFNAGVNFKSNARYPEEPLVIGIQYPHAMQFGSGAIVKPHFHWLQAQSAIPNFLLGYKKSLKNTTITIETDFTNYTFLIPQSNAFTYSSGVLYQITTFNTIDISEMGLSDTLDLVFFRDSTNVSTLFGGADPVATDVIVKYIDCHVMFNSSGSRQEYIK